MDQAAIALTAQQAAAQQAQAQQGAAPSGNQTLLVDYSEEYPRVDGQASHHTNARRENDTIEQQQLNNTDQQVKRLPTHAGNTTQLVKEWVREVQLTVPYYSCTVYRARKTAQSAHSGLRGEQQTAAGLYTQH